jgi:hypothetical protein
VRSLISRGRRRSWLSQWSVDRSNADGVTHIKRVTVPTIFVENSADDGVPRYVCVCVC